MTTETTKTPTFSETRKENGLGGAIFIFSFMYTVMLLVPALVIYGIVGLFTSDGKPQEQLYVHEDGTPLSKSEIAAFKASPDKFVSYTRSAQSKISSGFTEQQVCRATIGALMGRTPRIISSSGSGTMFLSYVRNDGKRWNYKCRIEGNRVIWGADDGRWRTHPMDARITFGYDGAALTIKQLFNDGSQLTKTYHGNDLGAA